MAQTQNLTVMFTDIVDFTERTSRQSRAENKAMLKEHNRLLLPLIGRFGGRRIKSIGDALLLTFQSPTDAVHCGMAMHDTLAEYNFRRAEPDQLHIRVAINVGEVRVDGSDIFGEAVNVASRVEGLTPPDHVYFTEAVYLAMNKAEVPSVSIGKHKLKGIPEEVRIFQVPIRQVTRLVPGGEDLGDAPGEFPFGGMHRMRPASASLKQMVGQLAQSAQQHVNVPKLSLPSRSPPPLRRLLPLFLALAAVLMLAIWPSLQRSAPEVEPDLAQSPLPLAAAETKPAPALPNPEVLREREAQTWLQKGHVAFEKNRRMQAVPAYAKALALAPSLQNDPVLAERLAACLSWASELAIPVIRKYPSPAIIAAVAARTASVRDFGAQRAADLLVSMGRAEKIDPAYVAMGKLEQAQTCEAKLEAIKRLRALRDPRSLAPLEASLGSGVKAWFNNRCFRDEAETAIKEIKQAQLKPG